MDDTFTTQAQAPASEGQGLLGFTPATQEPEKQDSEFSDEKLSQRAAVKHWQDRIRKARDKWEDDYDRMRENMDFVSGIQWASQEGITFDKCVVNMTLRTVNQGVASLYARNPQVVARRRQRLDFQMWDGHMETIQTAVMQAMQGAMTDGDVPPELMALISDFQQGRQRQQLIEKVGKTLEYVYQYQMDSQSPRFKLQMKQLVRRVRVCGVGYIKVKFCREYEDEELTQSETRLSQGDRIKRAQAILEKLREGKLLETDKEVEQLRLLVASLGASPLDTETTSLKERLVFDFPRATSVVPDTATQTLKGWVGTHWLVEETYEDVSFVNAFYETDIKVDGGEVKSFGASRKDDTTTYAAGESPKASHKKVRLWRVYDLDSKSDFLLCDGYKDYVQEPDTVAPATRGFWTIFPVTFNDIEVEDGCKATIFPPSDVDLLKSTQKEWNRVRQALRRHRIANGPKYVYPNGVIDDEDLDRIESAEDQQYFPLKIPQGAEPNKILQPLLVVPIQQELYDTEPLREDSLLATGQQEANIGPAQPNVTATVGTIAEQSRMSVAASDVDGLDDSLTEVAQCGGEMILQEFSTETVKRIAGPGAVWPEQNKQDFLNELELEIVAASSGRPNKAVEIANWDKIAPLLIQSGANPQAIIRETVKRFDDRLEPSDFYPLPAAPTPQGEDSGKDAPMQPGEAQMNPAPTSAIQQ